MKGKKFIVIIAIFVIICSLQTTFALEDNNLTASQIDDVDADDNLKGTLEDVSVQDSEISHDSNISQDDSVIEDESSQPDSSDSDHELLGVDSQEEVLRITTPGVLVYGVDYDTNYADADEVPLERFFKAIFWGIRDYVRYESTPTTEWNVFLNNKTFTGGYGDAGVSSIQSGYNVDGNRVYYLAMTRLAGYSTDNIAITIHLYGGANESDSRKSTLDLSDYGASYALLDFSTKDSSIKGINFVNFDVTKHSNSNASWTTTPFIRLGDASNPSYDSDDLIQDCTFENITLNPNQPLYEFGQIGEVHYNIYSTTESLDSFFKFVFWKVRDTMATSLRNGQTPIREWNVFLDNTTFTGTYSASNAISTGYKSWVTSSSQYKTRANYLTFRNLNPRYNSYDEDYGDVTIYLYGGFSKTDGLTSTLDLSNYSADYTLMDLSGGASSITGVNFKNYNVYKSKNNNSDTSMPFIFFGDNRLSNYGSSLVNCTFENITLNPKQALISMVYRTNPQDESALYSGGVVENCIFKSNNASQMLSVAGKYVTGHSDFGPIFYGFNASGNTFIDNVGTAEYASSVNSLGLCFKIWNEAFNVTLDNNRFINNTNAVHGAAYCIIGFNATITNNYFEANQAVFGAGIEAHNGNITIRNCTFVKNVASGNHSQNPYRDGSAAAIALLGVNNLIDNCTFKENVAYGHAGAIDIVGGMKSEPTTYYLTANNTVISNSRFLDNLALDYAGAVHINGTNTRIDNSTFLRNNASYAGAVNLIGENVTIVNSSFESNSAIQGGACYIEGENTQILESEFLYNYATHNVNDVRPDSTLVSAGGALYIIGSYTNVTNNIFVNNTADRINTSGQIEGLGGAIYMNGKNLTFSFNNYTNNSALQGGAVYINGDGIYASYMNFTNNTAVEGGAVYIIGSNTVINNSMFYNNTATRSIDTINTTGTDAIEVTGGAVDIVGYSAIITNSEFINNDAFNGDGGAIAIDGHLANITSNKFRENEAIHGGAVYIESVSTYSNIVNANFTDNKAVRGGAIFIKGSNTNIGEVNFTNNFATLDLSFDVNSTYANWNAVGGAVGILGNNSFIYNATFYNNTAVGENISSYGGAIAIQGYNTTLEGTSFSFNQAVIGGALYFSGTLNDLNNTEFVSNSAVQGGALYIANSNATFGNSKFLNNSATHELRFDLNSDLQNLITVGGAVYIPGNSIYVYGSEFINNTAYAKFAEGGLGGAIAVNGSDNYIINSKFDNNQAIKGGAFLLEGDRINITGSNFTNNRAIISGVGYIDGVYSLVDASIFENNYATHDGFRFQLNDELSKIPTVAGALNIIGENINISSSTFKSNNAVATNDNDSTGAGAIYIEGNNATISNSLFDSNHALKGGAIFIVVNDTDVIDCNFTANSVNHFSYLLNGLGGAVYLENASDSDFIGCSFLNNTASINGGAIDWHEGCVDGLIDDCLFADNSAAANGGAIYWFGEGGVIKNSNFTNNKANGTAKCILGNFGEGGAIMWTGSNGDVENCIFANNNANQHGGAVFLRGVEGHANCTNNSFINSQFENNSAADGGALYWAEGSDNGNVVSSSFTNNTALENGGAIYWNGHNGTIRDSNFTKNTALKGGAVYWSGDEGNIHGSRFISNSATEGGAIFIQNNTKSTNINLLIDDSYFESNTALNDGGAVNWNEGKTITVSNTRFTNNTAVRGGALFINGDSDISIANSNFTYNEAVLGGAAYLNTDATSIDSSSFDYNNAVQGGAVFIAADNSRIANSNFTYNNATYNLRVSRAKGDNKTRGGAVYIDSKNNVISDSKFYNNTAVATNDSVKIVQTTPGLLGAYLDVSGVDDDGLGGAIYINGDNNQINSSEFDYNVARNGSAVYNDASGTIFSSGLFVKNQAWSYVLEVNATPDKVYHAQPIPINVYGYIGGDNIINGIYNAKGVNDVTFDSVGYVINDDESQIKTTSEAHPVLGAQDGVLYQDSLERYQPIVVEVISNQTGKTLFNTTVLTDYEGNSSFKISGSDLLMFTPGNYTVIAYHPEDRNYKYIITQNTFEVIPDVILSVNKTADDNDYGIGDIITFTITVTNTGPSNATNVVVNDTLPQGLQLVDGYSLTNTIESLLVGESVNITIKAQAIAEGNWTNIASANCAENATAVEGNVTVPVFNPDLKIKKTANVTATIVGNRVNFTINVTNHGIRDATNITVTDILDTQAFNVISYSEEYYSGNYVWVIDKLVNGESYLIWIEVETLTNGTFTNNATVNCSEEGTLKRSTASVRVYDPNFNVTKVALDEVAYNGKETSFKIVINNTGDMDLTGLFVDEIIPDGLTYDHLIGANWTKDGNKFYYSGSLAVGDSVELIIVVIPTKSGNFTNNIVAGGDNVTNKTANASVVAYSPSLEIREISNNPEVLIGQPVSFTVVVTNTGDCDLGNITVNNIFPSGLTYTGYSGDSWSKDGNNFVFSGVLKPGESINYTLTFNTVQRGTQKPEVYASSNLTSNDTSDAYSSNVTNVLVPEITVKKTSDKKSVKVGDIVTFVITVKNTGDCEVGGVFVIDKLPRGLQFVRYSGEGWSKSGDRYDYNGTLDLNETATLIIECRATRALNVTNVVTAGSNLTGNVTDSADVSIINEDSSNPNKTSVNKTHKTQKPVQADIDEKATGNPILVLLLVILAIIPLRRRKQ